MKGSAGYRFSVPSNRIIFDGHADLVRIWFVEILSREVGEEIILISQLFLYMCKFCVGLNIRIAFEGRESGIERKRKLRDGRRKAGEEDVEGP